MKQPQLTTPSDISLHEPLRRTLPNGVTIHTLCAAEFEVVRVSFVFRAGSAQQRKAFVATSTANLLSEGTRDMTSQQIAEQFDFYGSYFDVNVDRDYAYINFATLSKFFAETLAVAKHILLRPNFVGPEEFEASHDAPCGRIVSAWTRRGNTVTYRVRIPANSTATLYLPANVDGGKVHQLGAGSHTLTLRVAK